MTPIVLRILGVAALVVLACLLAFFAVATHSAGSALIFVAYVVVGAILVTRSRGR